MAMERRSIRIEGIVQGVGFRPFVYQLARRCGLTGWVRNDSRGVLIEAQGEKESLARFLDGLRDEHPPLAAISRFEVSALPPIAENGFSILASDATQEKTAQIAPDTHVCADCLRELFDPADRRYLYPFINCTNCGPRYTIVTAIPYDRPNTTMVDFPLCPDCLEEYRDPTSRRFHAQPNACPVCGPRLALVDRDGQAIAGDPLAEAVARLKRGGILAVKGLGGYHLAADADNGAAVAELRRRKARDEKPFALMIRDLAAARELAEFDETERRLLAGPERPIVLLRARPDHGLSPLIAPRNRYLGLMLPYTPLHHLLLRDFPALVMTSANLSDEPIAFEDGEARSRLGGIADAFLVHNRAIHTRADDSIARVMAGRPLMLRRSRGYVPRAVFLPVAQASVLAVGAELKNTVCLTQGDRAYLSQHIGDLKNLEVHESFVRTIKHLKKLFEVDPQIVAHDLHPDYDSSRYAETLPGVRRIAVQHHHAHLASCMAEQGLTGEVLGLIFDGIGYGADGHIWGGEFLAGGYGGYRRLGHFHYVPMPGGDAATREPARMALSYLHQAFGAELPPLPVVKAIPAGERTILLKMIERGINAPLTSSCGRLFDAVAALVGLRDKVSYEGQAALELEMAIEPDEGEYPFDLEDGEGGLIFDPAPLVRALVGEILAGVAVGRVSARFHNSLALMMAAVARRLREATGLNRVVLSGGVFQNLYLVERGTRLLQAEGFEVFTHSLVPPNDGGLALGQAVVAGFRVGEGS
ncbi:carbamoyltransferase HypF [Trichloromonas acetexigens]|uniref:Carbamoyltransferase n=1 Tax=Trichloromonas acetexigens TaxID=38815 RepID=A0A550JDK8_9BACT|nr:carbamoyltransferase HypF [Desulfuromonas acetexigens]